MIDLPEPTSYWFISYKNRSQITDNRIISVHPFEWEIMHSNLYTLISFQKMTEEDVRQARNWGRIS